MGANVWRDEHEWPLARARATPYYLHSKGMANTRFGDGALSTEAPGDEPADRYRYDPRNPVPTYGGHGCCDYSFAAMGPLDQRVNQQRSDVLVYSTAPLTEDTEVTGIVEAKLVFSTDVPDTDFFVTLSDVYPDGQARSTSPRAKRARAFASQRKANAAHAQSGGNHQHQALGHEQPVQAGAPHPRAHHEQQLPALQPQSELRQADGRGN